MDPKTQDVRSYFLDAGLGDVAVHMLVDRTTGHLKSTVLIDDGIGPSKLSIAFGIRTIPELVSNPTHRFDAVVLSRFPTSHDAGVLQFLYDDWLSSSPRESSHTTPQTVFYCPLTASAAGVTDKSYIRVQKQADSPDYHLQFRGQQVDDPWTSVCRAMPSTFALGYDIFSGSPYHGGPLRTEPPPTSSVSFDDIYKDCNSLSEKIQPIFLIYGIDGHNLDAGTETKWPEPEHYLVATEPPQVVSQSSIIALVLWPASVEEDDHVEQRRISLYTGGSATPAQEDQMVRWINGCQEAPKSGSLCSLDVVKAGSLEPWFSTAARVTSQNVQHVINTGQRANQVTLANAYRTFSIAHSLSSRITPNISSTRVPKWLLTLVGTDDDAAGDPGTIMNWTDSALELDKLLADVDSALKEEGMSSAYLLDTFGDIIVRHAIALAFSAQGEKVCTEIIKEHPNYVLSKVYTSWDADQQHEYVNPTRFPKDATAQTVARGVQGAIGMLWATQQSLPNLNTPRPLPWIKTVAAGNSPTIARSTKAITSALSLKVLADAPIWRSANDLAWTESLGDTDALSTASNCNFNPDVTTPRKEAPDAGEVLAAAQAVDAPSVDDPKPPGCDSIKQWIDKVLAGDLELDAPKFDKQFTDKESNAARWFGVSLSTNSSLRLIGGVGEDKSAPNLEQVDLLLALESPGAVARMLNWLTSTNASNLELLFTTENDVLVMQFGKDAADRLSASGYSEDLDAVVLALKTELPTDPPTTFTLTQLATFVGFPVPAGNLSKIFGAVELEHYIMSAENQAVGRSGIWFMPQFNSRTITRVQMSQAAGSGELGKVLAESLGLLDLREVVFVGISHCESFGPKYTQRYSKLSMQATFWLQLASQASGDKNLPPILGKTELVFAQGGAEMAINFEHSESLLPTLLAWAQELLLKNSKRSPPSSQSVEDTANQIQHVLTTVLGSTEILVSRIRLGLDGDLKPFSFAIDMEVSMALAERKRVPFKVTLCWDQGTFDLLAQIWQHFPCDPTPKELYPFYEVTSLGAPQCPNPVYTIDIRTILRLPYDARLPRGVPNTVSAAHLRVDFGQKHGNISSEWSAELTCTPAPKTPATPSNKDPSKPPTLHFDTVSLQAGAHWAGEGADPNVSTILSARLALSLPNRSKSTTGTKRWDNVPIDFTVKYKREDQKPAWVAVGEVSRVNVGHLIELFPQDGSGHAIMDIMGDVFIPTLGITHSQTANGDEENELNLQGTMLFGSDSAVELDFTYHHSVSDGWNLVATLEPGAPGADFQIIDLLKKFMPEWQELPGFIQNLEVPKSELKAKLTCTKTKDDEVVFALCITIGSITISLAQIRAITAAKSIGDTTEKQARDHEGADPALSENVKKGGGDEDSADAPKDDEGEGMISDKKTGRLLRVILTELPSVPTIPIVGTVPKPFDELGVVWTNREIAAAELKTLNDSVFPTNPFLSGKGAKATDVKPLAKGLHFQVAILDDDQPKLLVDAFAAPKAEPTSSKPAIKSNTPSKSPTEPPVVPISKTVQRHESQSDTSSAVPDNSKSVEQLSRSFGPLSVSGIGVSVDPDRPNIMRLSLDGTLTIGPLSVSLLGLSLAVDLSEVKHLADLKSLTFKPSIRGMAIEYNKPPTRLAGMLLSFDDTTEAGYEGAIAVSMATWSAVAGGMYTEAKSAGHSESLFVFGAVRGIIFTVGAVEVDGLTGGYGYNSRLRLPKLPEVADFPFLALNRATGPQPELKTQLTTMTTTTRTEQPAWITPAPDDLWLVAGMGFKAFQSIDGQILLAMALTDEPRFSVLAQATAIFPKSAAEAGIDPLKKALLLLDIVMGADIDPAHGTIMCAGKLTPRSFILDQSCHLTGGFALVFFLEGSPHEGDFCFSVGGYARGYEPPAHYPPAPERVGINWRYDSDISITGESYFAVTPQVVMGGGRLALVFDKSWVRVHFSAWADFFMHLHPFSFMIDIGVSLTASLSIPALFWTIHFGPFDFSANLTLFGPSLGGTASVDLWGYDVTVAFGADRSSPPPLSWQQFLRLVKNLHTDANEDSPVANHVIRVTRGLVPVGEGHSRKTELAKSSADGGDNNKILVRRNHLQFSIQARIPILSQTADANAEVTSATLHARPMLLSGPITESKLRVTLTHMVFRENQWSSAGEIPLKCTAQTRKPVAPSLFGAPAGKTASRDTANEGMIMHTMGIEYEVLEQPRQLELPKINMRDFNSAPVGDPKKNVMVVRKHQTLEESGVLKASEPTRREDGPRNGPRELTYASRGPSHSNRAHDQRHYRLGKKPGLDKDVINLWKQWKSRPGRVKCN